MDIYQIELKFVGQEDRILMCLNSKEDEEIRFWLTRRCVKAFWPVLEKMLGADPALAGFEPHTQQAGVAFLHEHAMSKMDETQTFKQGSQFPLGDTPILIVKITMRTSDSHKTLLGLYPEQGQGIEIERGHPVLNYLYQHLPNLSKEAQWGLSLKPFTLEVEKPDKDKLH